MNRLVPALLALAPMIAGCGGDDDGGGDSSDSDDSSDVGDQDAGPDSGLADPATDAGGLIADRPYELFVPEGHDAEQPAPLVVLVHGFGASGALQLAYFGLAEVAQEQGLLVAYPDGTEGPAGRFWTATDACCAAPGEEVDDVAYLTAVMDDVAANYSVDPARVFVVGHSNGGFMSHRMACDRAERVAAIVSLAGATWADPSQCEPSEPVAVLQVHGTLDTTIVYNGGDLFGVAYPSAADTVATWADLNGCTGDLETTAARRDLDSAVVGQETRIDRYAGCPAASTEVELWSLEGGGHLPGFINPAWPEAFVEFLLAHPKK
jgi:polyhydroxybutyrate depolymerase